LPGNCDRASLNEVPSLNVMGSVAAILPPTAVARYVSGYASDIEVMPKLVSSTGTVSEAVKPEKLAAMTAAPGARPTSVFELSAATDVVLVVNVVALVALSVLASERVAVDERWPCW
jgi:hypothetical protein